MSVAFGVRVAAFLTAIVLTARSGRDTARGRPVLHATLSISGGVWPLAVRDSIESRFDSTSFASSRFVQELRERRHRAGSPTTRRTRCSG